MIARVYQNGGLRLGLVGSILFVQGGLRSQLLHQLFLLTRDALLVRGQLGL